VTVPVEGGGRAEVVTDAHTRGEGAMAAVCAVTVEGAGDGGGASYGAMWGVGEEAAVCVGALQMLVAHVVADKKALGEGVDAVVRLDGGEGGGGGELVVHDQLWSKPLKTWTVANRFCIKLQVSGRAMGFQGRSPPHIRCVCMRAQVDGRVGFEAAVSAATSELRAGVAVERDAAAGVRRAIAVLRGEVAGLDSREATAQMQAERAAASAELAALQQVLSDLRRDLAAAAAERDQAREHLAWVITDAISRQVAYPLAGPMAGAYLRACGFPVGSQPAGITWGIDTVPAGRLTSSSVYSDRYALHPGCRLMYPPNASGGVFDFAPQSCCSPDEWVCVDLGGERSVVGALVQGRERGDWAASLGFDGGFLEFKFQWSADGAAWTDADGGRVWSRRSMRCPAVKVAVFGAPVRCRYLRIVAVSHSGALRWEVVVLP
jgi:hypothetical protein